MSPSSAAAPGGAVRIRKAGPDDAQAIDRMVTALSEHVDALAKKTSGPRDIERALAAMPPLLNGLIAEDGAGPVGLCLWFPFFSSWRGHAGLYVQDLYIAPRARRAGLARRLLAAAAAEAGGYGAAFLRLGVDKSNIPAIEFYGRLGFERMEAEHVLDLFGKPFDKLLGSAGAAPERQQRGQSDTA